MVGIEQAFDDTERVAEATREAKGLRAVETIGDAGVAEAHRSAETFAEVEEASAPLDRFLSLIHALDWFDVRNKHDMMAM